MTNEQEAKGHGAPSFWLGCLIAFAILVVLIGWIILGQHVLGLQNPWVGLVALTVFGSVYQNNFADAPKVWIGSAAALVIGHLLWYVPTLVGPAGGLVGVVLIIVCLGAMIAQKLPLVCNFGLFFMLTVSTASIQIMKEQSHLMYLLDLAYGAVCFWLIPVAIIKLKEKMAK